jgi:hypothetical protein
VEPLLIYFERASESKCSWGRKCRGSGTWLVYSLQSLRPALGQCLGLHCSAHALRRADDMALHIHPQRVRMLFGRPPGWS